MTLQLRHARSGALIDFAPRSLIVAGFTGSDQSAVAAHIEELERMGVPCPSETPVFYRLPTSLLTTDDTIEAAGAETSGEVEPVLFFAYGASYVGVGSDHTDREIERDDIGRSKSACPKVVGREVIDYDEAVHAWPSFRLSSTTHDGAIYQDGTANELLPIPNVLDCLRDRGHELADGTVVFLGTIPLRNGSFEYSSRWNLEMQPPGGPTLRCTYTVSTPA